MRLRKLISAIDDIKKELVVLYGFKDKCEELQKQLDELRSMPEPEDQSEHIAKLRARIVELEKEKQALDLKLNKIVSELG